MHFPTERIVHTTSLDEPVVGHWLEWNISQTANASAMQDRSVMQEDPNLYSRVLYCLSYVPRPDQWDSDAILSWTCDRHTMFPIPVLDSGAAVSRGLHGRLVNHSAPLLYYVNESLMRQGLCV